MNLIGYLYQVLVLVVVPATVLVQVRVFFFHASVLSNLVTPDGVAIQDIYWKPRSYHCSNLIRHSNHNWPVQQQPDWDTFHIWKKGLRATVPIANNGYLRHRLGSWKLPTTDSANNWSSYWDALSTQLYLRQPDNSYWKFNDCERLLTGNRFQFSVAPDEIILTLPPSVFPVHIQQYPDKIIALPGNHREVYVPAPILRFNNFDDYILSLPQWRGDLLTHWQTMAVNELQHVFSIRLPLLLASDGSYHQSQQYGSFGAVVGTQDHNLMQIHGNTPGTDHLLSSHRSELYGLLAMCVLLSEVTKYCDLAVHDAYPVQIYIDSKSVLDRLERHRHQRLHLGDYLAANIDVELQILQELKELQSLGFKIPPIRHVKAHQDEVTPYDQLTREAQLNVTADQLAACMMTGSYYNMPYSIFPTTLAQLYINNNPITSKYKENIRTAYHTQDLREYYCIKHQWDSHRIDDIWWDIHGDALKMLSNSERQQIQKYNIRRLHTNNRQHLHKTFLSDKCMFCSNIVETNDHILQCMRCTSARVTARAKWIQTLYEHLEETYTPGECQVAILTAISCWIHTNKVPDISDVVPNASESLRQAYTNQTRIGWDNLLRGKMSISWHEYMHYHLITEDISPKLMTAQRWGTHLLVTVWKGILQLWTIRNQEKHGNDVRSQNEQLKLSLLQEVHHSKQQGQDCSLEDVDWFHTEASVLQEYSITNLQAWIKNARTILRLYHQEIRAQHHSSLDQTSTNARRKLYDRGRNGRRNTVNYNGSLG